MPSIHVKIVDVSQQLSEELLQMHTHAAFFVGSTAAISTLPYGERLQQQMRRREERLHDDQVFVTDLPNANATRIALAVMDTGSSAFERLTRARKLIAAIGGYRNALLGSVALPAAQATLATEALLAAALAAAAPMPHFRSGAQKKRSPPEIGLLQVPQRELARTVAEAEGNNLARYLTALPTNELTPQPYRKRIESLAREAGWQMSFLDIPKLRARKAGAFLAVAQGSPKPDAGIVHLRYAPKGKTKKPALALVGKGICFDTGGVNLKTAKGMYGMHEDMEGSAVALGTMLALTRMRVDFPIECWLALAQNHIGPNAYKPNDVVTAANGTTIEVVHTDAEGRMVLADTLYFAARTKPALIIDYATLTGSCIQALGTRYSGATTNRPALIPKIIAAGRDSGERVWPFPFDADYAQELKSDIADIKQCTLGSEADHILAPIFLQRFVGNDSDWVHIDLAGGNHKGGLAHVPTDVTGFGVRFTLNLLFEQAALHMR